MGYVNEREPEATKEKVTVVVHGIHTVFDASRFYVDGDGVLTVHDAAPSTTAGNTVVAIFAAGQWSSVRQGAHKAKKQKRFDDF